MWRGQVTGKALSQWGFNVSPNISDLINKKVEEFITVRSR